MPPSPSPERLLEVIAGMSGRPVLILADLVADRFVTGAPKRISREAPVLILSYEGEELRPGGGANAVANMAALGGRPLPVGVVGDDEGGRGLLLAFERLGIPTDGILRRPGYHTPTKVRILAGHRHAIKQQVVRYDVDQTGDLGPADRASLERALERWKGQARVAVLSDYGYGAVHPELVTVCRAALAGGGVLLCDSRHALAELAGIDGATPNEEEAEALLGAPLGESHEALELSGRRLLSLLAARFLLITRGSLGMSLFEAEGSSHLPVHGTDQVADVTGAGDTVIGAFALALAAGASPLEAALVANYAGGVVVMKQGTATVSQEELREAVVSDPRPLEELAWARS
jgi:D-glycero-beta-D-manno-heptose-7-phosphate kinase